MTKRPPSPPSCADAAMAPDLGPGLRGVPRHHARAEVVLELAALQRERLVHQGLCRKPFALLTSNSIVCCATVRAAADLGASMVLLPNRALLPLSVEQAHVGCLVGLGEDGTLLLLEGGEQLAGCDRPWLNSSALPRNENPSESPGVCVLVTSGSSQAGPKLVAYRWEACRRQATTTVQRTLTDAAPGGGKVRFVAASNVGHAYNFNGFMSALEAGAELCVPRDAGELAQTLLADPLADCESTVLFATPAMYKNLLEEDTVISGAVRAAVTGNRTLHAYSAGCPLPPETAGDVAEKLGIKVLQNYGTSETGIIALQELPRKSSTPALAHDGLEVGVPWGRMELRPPEGGRLLPEGAEGEVCVAVEWMSEGYVQSGELVPHGAPPFFRTGDAGRWSESRGGSTAETRTLVLMQRLLAPLQVSRGGLRLLLQPYEVERALLAADGSLTVAAALQGPAGTLHCAVAGAGEGPGGPAMQGPIQPDRLLRLGALPTSPAGKVLYSRLAALFAEMEKQT